MRILVVNPNWNAYSEAWLRRMMAYIQESVVGLACFNPGQSQWNGTPTFDLYGKRTSFLSRIPGIRRWYVPNVSNDFSQFVKKAQPDLIFINFIGPAMYLIDSLKKTKIPVVIHVHGGDVFWDAVDELSGEFIHPGDYTKRVIELSSVIRKLTFIANSDLSKNQLLGIGIDETVIYRKNFGVKIPVVEKKNNQNLKLLYVGRFVDFKGPDIVVNAFIKACQFGFTGSLTMIGTGTLRPACQLIARRSTFHDRIRFVEPLDEKDLEEYYQTSDLLCMNSLHGELSNQSEAFGSVYIEAMSYGLVPITGNHAGPKEIIDHQVNGVLVNPGDVDAYVKEIMRLDQNRTEINRMSLNAIETIREKYTDVQERNRLNEVFDSVING